MRTTARQRNERRDTPFAGNGLSRTAMLFNIAKIAGHSLTPPN